MVVVEAISYSRLLPNENCGLGHLCRARTPSGFTVPSGESDGFSVSRFSTMFEVTLADVTNDVMPRNLAPTTTPCTNQLAAAIQAFDAMGILEVGRDNNTIDMLRAHFAIRTCAKAWDSRTTSILVDLIAHCVGNGGTGWIAVMFQRLIIVRFKHIAYVTVPCKFAPESLLLDIARRGFDDLQVLEMIWSSTITDGLGGFSAIRIRVRAGAGKTIHELHLCGLLMCLRGRRDSIR